MSVVVIGDKAVGKTSMVVTLADSIRSQNVKVVSPDPDYLRSKYVNPETGKPAGTSEKKEQNLEVKISLAGGPRQIHVRWVDTPGESWDNKDWKEEKLSAWQDLRKEVSNSQGLLLLLPPHKGLCKPDLLASATDSLEPDDLKTPTQWKTYLTSWLDFLTEECKKVRHIVLCIHKADLFCDIEAEGKKWQYDPFGSPPWYDYNKYILQQYFSTAHEQILAYNAQSRNRPLKFFITTTKNRPLLELPWIYLGAYIANT